jgi:arabinose-5-phosphate isomerase
MAAQALEIMEEHDIMQMVIVDAKHCPVGMVHLHDLLKAGIR